MDAQNIIPFSASGCHSEPLNLRDEDPALINIVYWLETVCAHPLTQLILVRSAQGTSIKRMHMCGIKGEDTQWFQ